MRWRCVGVRVAFFALLGIATTVAVSSTLSMFARFGPRMLTWSTSFVTDRGVCIFEQEGKIGVVSRTWEFEDARSFLSIFRGSPSAWEASGDRPFEGDGLPEHMWHGREAWGVFGAVEPEDFVLPDGASAFSNGRMVLSWVGSDAPPGSSGTETAIGWPLLAFRAGHVHMNTGQEALGAAIAPFRLTEWINRIPGMPYADPFVPATPIWSGLLINTAFYALAWFALFSFAGGVRRLRRFHRGACPRCRYDLRRDCSRGCSECGWRVEAPRAHARGSDVVDV
ncbi:MAG: hypothetical protein AAF235_03845 [Planctomycetota bacterium]